MSLIMDAWRQQGYAPPGSERMLQDYEDKLQMEQGRRDLMYALQYPPAPPPPPPPSPEDTRNEIYARIYPPSNGPAPPPELEDLSDGTLGVAGDVHAIRKVLDAGGVEHYLPFRHNSIVIGLPDVAKARNALAGVRWGEDAEATADEESGFDVGFAVPGTAGRAEPAGSNQGWAARPEMGAAAYEPPNALPSQVAQATRPAWADHIAGIDTPTLEGILAQRYVMQLRGGGAGGYRSEVSRRIDTDTDTDMDSDPAAHVGGLQNLSNRDSVGGRYAGAQLAASSTAGHAEAPAVPGSVNPGATATPGQAFLDGVAENLRESRGRGPTRASLYRDFVVSGKFGKLGVADQRVVLAALDSHANELTEGSMANGADAKAADAAVRYAADQARAAGAIDDRTRFAAEARVGATAAMAWLQPAIRRGQGAVKSTSEESSGLSAANGSRLPKESEEAAGRGNSVDSRVLFGQKRIGSTFGTDGRPAYIAGRDTRAVAADLKNGTIHPDQLPIDAFYHKGQLVSKNTRSLATLSEAGLEPTVVNIVRPSNAHLRRLHEKSVIPDAPLPGPRVAVTPSQRDLTILRIINLPENKP